MMLSGNGGSRMYLDMDTFITLRPGGILVLPQSNTFFIITSLDLLRYHKNTILLPLPKNY